MKRLLPVIIAILITNSAFAQLPLTGALVAWYPFCGNYNDQGPLGYNLINSGGTVLSIDRFLNPATADTFSGGSYLFFTAPFAATGPFTYSCWIYPTVAQSSIIWFNGNPVTDGFGLYMNNGTLGTAGTNV